MYPSTRPILWAGSIGFFGFVVPGTLRDSMVILDGLLEQHTSLRPTTLVTEIRQFGEYRTRRLILDAWDHLGLQPRNRDGRYDVDAFVKSPDLVASTHDDSASLLSPLTVRERKRTQAGQLPM